MLLWNNRKLVCSSAGMNNTEYSTRTERPRRRWPAKLRDPLEVILAENDIAANSCQRHIKKRLPFISE